MKNRLIKIRNKIFEYKNVQKFFRKVTGCYFDNGRRGNLTKNDHYDFYNNLIALLASGRNLTFVQVGANDGISDDPIRNAVLNCARKALLIEPQEWLIPSLKENYKDFEGELILENCAVDGTQKELTLFILPKRYWPQYIEKVGRHPNQLFSPYREQIETRLVERLGLKEDQKADYIEEYKVASRPLDEILRQHKLETVDVLQIDCEGHDVDVLMSIGGHRPKIINIEIMNLSESDWERFRDWCDQNNYYIYKFKQDCIALRKAEWA